MTRDTFLFLIIGILFGFIAGYWLHEVMTGVQPPRMAPGTGTVSTPDAGGAPGAPAAGAANSQAGMQQVQELAAYVEQNPDDVEAALQLAEMNFGIGNWPRAAELYERVLALQPESPGVLSDLGVAYRELGRFDEALAQFDRAQELDPDHWESRFNKVIVLAFDLNRPDEATQTLEELRSLQPDNPTVERLAEEVERARNAA